MIASLGSIIRDIRRGVVASILRFHKKGSAAIRVRLPAPETGQLSKSLFAFLFLFYYFFACLEILQRRCQFQAAFKEE